MTSENTPVEGYKAFNKGLTCKGFQFKENTIFEEKEAIICESGFHFCTNPFDVLNYYSIHDSEFCKVKALSTAISDNKTGDSKHVTTKIEIGMRMGLSGFVKELAYYFIDECKSNFSYNNNSCHAAQIGSVEDYAQIGSAGRYAQIGSAGDDAQISSVGTEAQIGSVGDYVKIGSAGQYAQIGSSGRNAKIGSAGNDANIGSAGNYARIGSAGNDAKIGSAGNYAKIGSAGDSAEITVGGHDSVCAATGVNSKIKSSVGNWITLAEWEYSAEKKRLVPLCVKSGFVDGKILKADVFYKLKNGEFVEVV